MRERDRVREREREMGLGDGVRERERESVTRRPRESTSNVTRHGNAWSKKKYIEREREIG